MKKSLIGCLVVMLMIVPCMLLLFACGDSSAPGSSSIGVYTLESISVDGKIISIPSDITYTTYITNEAPYGEKPEVTLAKPAVMVKMPAAKEPNPYLDLAEPGIGATADEVAAYNAEQAWKAFRENQEAWELYNYEVQLQNSWILEKAGYDTFVRLVNTCIEAGISPEIAENIMSWYAHSFTVLNSIKIMTEDNTATIAIPSFLTYVDIDYRIVDGNVLLNTFEFGGGVLGSLGIMGELGTVPVTIKYINGKLKINTLEGFLPLAVEIVFG